MVWDDFTVFHLEGKWPGEIGCHFILKPYLPRWGHRPPSTPNEEPWKWWKAHSREFSLMPCFHRLLIGIHAAKWKCMKSTLCLPNGGVCSSLFLITVYRTEDAGGDYYLCTSQQSPAVRWRCPHMVLSSLLNVPKKDAVPMRLVSMLALAASRIPGSACGFPLTVPCSGLRFVLWEGAAVPKLVTSRGIFFQRGPLWGRLWC